MSLRGELHDRLWRAYVRWHEMREQGATKHDLKMQGLREYGDVNRYTRNVIFTANTLHTYDRILGRFLESCPQAQRLEDTGKREFKAFMDRAITAGLSAKTLKTMSSALAKFGALTGRTKSFAALSEKYGEKIRALVRTGVIAGPSRSTPSVEILQRAIKVLQEWDARHFARTDEPRAYHLAAQLQWETSARGISATERVTDASLLDGNRIELVGKGGRRDIFGISSELHRRLRAWFAHNRGPLADLRGYQCAYRRAILAVGGRVTGTHGARRAAARAFFGRRYGEGRAAGLDPKTASRRAAGDAIERLGHSRDRRDHRRWYLGR